MAVSVRGTHGAARKAPRPAAASVQVLVVDDHVPTRTALRMLLSLQKDMKVAEAGDGRTAVRLAAELAPDVIVMDLAMEGMDGVEATRKILERNPQAKVLMVSNYGDAGSVRRALDAGARGYVSKDSAFDELNEAIRAVLAGRQYISRKLRASEG